MSEKQTSLLRFFGNRSAPSQGSDVDDEGPTTSKNVNMLVEKITTQDMLVKKITSYIQFVLILLKKHCHSVVHKFGTTYSQNGKISLTTDLKKLSKVTLLRIIAKSCNQSALSNLIL